MSKKEINKAKEVLEKDRQERINKCGEGIQKLLKKYNCDIKVTPRMVNEKIVSDISVTSN